MWFGYYPIEVRQTGARHSSMFLDIAAVPGIAWQPIPALRLVGSIGIGLGIYLPPDDGAIPVPWFGAPVDGPTLLFHLRPAVALEWPIVGAFGLYAVPLAVDIDVPLGSGVLRPVVVDYLAMGGVAAHFQVVRWPVGCGSIRVHAAGGADLLERGFGPSPETSTDENARASGAASSSSRVAAASTTAGPGRTPASRSPDRPSRRLAITGPASSGAGATLAELPASDSTGNGPRREPAGPGHAQTLYM